MLWSNAPEFENFGKFGEMNVIHQYFTPAKFLITKVAIMLTNYCKFANIFLAKTLKRLIHESFTLPKFCTIWYAPYLILTNSNLYFPNTVQFCISS